MLKVNCYSGYRANERPVSFSLGEKEFQVKEILDRWYGPDYQYFKVKADDENIYILKYDENKDFWELEFYREGERDTP
ncbi:MAG TPA: hypothetical protein DHV62_06960 [Elusimicrobia bacterium]|jgi:hypothetical protein|nr:hypothetical protein [Elusimicrobiota bacterium]